MRRIRLMVGFLAALLAMSIHAADAPLTNDDVIRLVKLSLGDDVVIAKIRQTASSAFRLEVDDLANLKAAGVSSKVMQAMLERPTRPSATAMPVTGSPTPANELEAAYARMGGPQPGMSVGTVWLLEGDTPVRLKTSTGQMRTAGVGMKMINPFGKLRLMRAFNGDHANVRAKTMSPQFEVAIPAQNNPGEAILLVKLKSVEDRREIATASGRFGMSTGISEEDTVPIRISEKKGDPTESSSTATYRVTALTPIDPGEYAVVVMGHSFFDFGIDIPQ
jgi:hypothetical protein